MFIWMLYIQICVCMIYIYVWFSSQFTPLLVSDLNYSLLIFLMGFKQLICVYILLIFKWQLYCAVQNDFQFVLLQLELQKGVPSLYLDYVVLSHLFLHSTSQRSALKSWELELIQGLSSTLLYQEKRYFASGLYVSSLFSICVTPFICHLSQGTSLYLITNGSMFTGV